MKLHLALAPLSIVLALGLSACDGDAKAVPQNDPASPATSSTAPVESQVPEVFDDETAQAAVAELCDSLNPEDVATLLGLSEVKVEHGIIPAVDPWDMPKAHCLFDAPEATTGATPGEDGQTFLSIIVEGAAVPAPENTGSVVKFGDGSTGYYGGNTDDTKLLVSPTGSPYQFGFAVSLPYEPGVGGMDATAVALVQQKAAEAAGSALN